MARSRTTTRILICDDHAVVRTGLRQVLEAQPELVVVAEAADGRAALRELSNHDIDVLVLDLALPDRAGLDVLEQVRVMVPGLPVLVLSMYDERKFGPRVLRAGASGYLEKTAGAAELVAAVRKVATGARYMSRALAEQLACQQLSGGTGPAHESLTAREFQVMTGLAKAGSVKEIAKQLCLSVKTVSNYRLSLLKKLELKNEVELTRYALDHGLLP